MGATSVVMLDLAKIRLPKKPKVAMATTVVGELRSDSTSLPVGIVLSGESGYTDAQFYADLKKASKWLDAMEAEALKEEAEGKTREFPV